MLNLDRDASFLQGSFQASFSDEALFKNLALRGFSLSALPRDFQSLCATGPQLYPTRTCALLRLRACACACACLRACARPFSCACVLAHLCALARPLRGIFTCTYAPTDPRPRATRPARRPRLKAERLANATARARDSCARACSFATIFSIARQPFVNRTSYSRKRSPDMFGMRRIYRVTRASVHG